MNKLLLNTLLYWPKSFMTGIDLYTYIPGTEAARKSIITRAVHEGYLEREKNELYIIRNIPQQHLLNTFELAQFIWGPSYISFESALSFHRWIPEAVKVTTSATSKRSKDVETKMGVFSFEKIPEDIFPVGVSFHLEGDSRYLLASPWKAVSDIIYSRNKEWADAQSLSEDLRIERNYLKTDRKMLNYLSIHYPNKRTQKILKNIVDSL